MYGDGDLPGQLYGDADLPDQGRSSSYCLPYPFIATAMSMCWTFRELDVDVNSRHTGMKLTAYLGTPQLRVKLQA
jgi:hypothetical protein